MRSLIDRAARNLNGLLRNADFGDSSIPSNSAGGWLGNPDGVVRSERGALAVSTVLNCVKVLHNDFGVLPFFAFAGDKQKVRAPIAQQPLIVTDPFGPDLSRNSGMGQIVASMALRGNSYLLVTMRDQYGFPTQVRILHPDTVSVEQDRATHAITYKLDRVPIPRQDIKHIRGMMLPGAVMGIDPVSFQRVAWSLAASVQEYGLNFFLNGGAPEIVLSFPGEGDRDKAKKMLAVWTADHSGVQNAHRPAVMFGDGKIEHLTVSPENAQFLQTKMSTREDICGWFGVPLQRIQAIVENASQGGGKGLDSIDAGYVKHTLLAIATGIESCWDSMIPGNQGTWTRFDFDEYLRADAKERAQVHQIHRLIGSVNNDEVRADEGMAAIPNGGGADYKQPFNSATTSPSGGSPNEPGASDAPPTSTP